MLFMVSQDVLKPRKRLHVTKDALNCTQALEKHTIENEKGENNEEDLVRQRVMSTMDIIYFYSDDGDEIKQQSNALDALDINAFDEDEINVTLSNDEDHNIKHYFTPCLTRKFGCDLDEYAKNQSCDLLNGFYTYYWYARPKFNDIKDEISNNEYENCCVAVNQWNRSVIHASKVILQIVGFVINLIVALTIVYIAHDTINVNNALDTRYTIAVAFQRMNQEAREENETAKLDEALSQGNDDSGHTQLDEIYTTTRLQAKRLKDRKWQGETGHESMDQMFFDAFKTFNICDTAQSLRISKYDDTSKFIMPPNGMTDIIILRQFILYSHVRWASFTILMITSPYFIAVSGLISLFEVSGAVTGSNDINGVGSYVKDVDLIGKSNLFESNCVTRYDAPYFDELAEITQDDVLEVDCNRVHKESMHDSSKQLMRSLFVCQVEDQDLFVGVDMTSGSRGGYDKTGERDVNLESQCIYARYSQILSSKEEEDEEEDGANAVDESRMVIMTQRIDDL
eukprot:886801_1